MITPPYPWWPVRWREAFEAGMKAAEDGKDLGRNPYDGRTYSGRKWKEGWQTVAKRQVNND